ncbi:MAG: tRNA (adenosine(37)-N6)-threonylcarbamoyltransferase complex transferase subunit TsaD [Myxococcales bacterium]|nr:tRNA (adenosine(37)-N6)-threonylcarbamoyltransferase complex transferase subunit TsaD [Myxococcales bacterium]
MLILGLESSCDETAAAVVRGRGARGHVLADVVASQHDVHRPFGGVVPELASRAHIEHVIPVVDAALTAAGVTLADLDAIAVTCGPGLIGALLVAVQTAKAMAYGAGKPLVGVHHLEGHMSAIYLEERAPPMPHLALIVSGGHTSLVLVTDHGSYGVLGQTRDDAAGEAFDKGAKLLGLGYPGGVLIDQLANGGDPQAISFPRAMLHKESNLDFSFSGLKTALLHWVRANGVPGSPASTATTAVAQTQSMQDVCASYQHAIVEVLVRKTRAAVEATGVAAVQLCGGVAANSALRAGMAQAGLADGFELFVPKPSHCTDNAAMIAMRGYFRFAAGGRDELTLDSRANWPLPHATPQWVRGA